MNHFYIISGNSRTGPYDMVTMVRKIRNGSLTETTPIQDESDAQPKPARDWPALQEFFQEKKESSNPSQGGTVKRNLDLGKGLKGGWHFLQNNPFASIVSAFYMLLVIGMIGIAYTALPHYMRGIGYMVCFVLSYFTLCCYLLFILRVIRGQPVELSYFTGKLLSANRPSLLTLSVLVSIPTLIGIFFLSYERLFNVLLMQKLHLPEETLLIAMPFIGLVIFIIPGLSALTMYAFAPMLMLDQGCSPGEAMRKSRTAIFSSGTGNFVVIYLLFIINFIAILFALMPLTISLPITMNALCEFYEEFFG